MAQNTDLAQALAGSRQRIDAIDDQIVKLLNERAQVVLEVGSTEDGGKTGQPSGPSASPATRAAPR